MIGASKFMKDDLKSVYSAKISNMGIAFLALDSLMSFKSLFCVLSFSALSSPNSSLSKMSVFKLIILVVIQLDVSALFSARP